MADQKSNRLWELLGELNDLTIDCFEERSQSIDVDLYNAEVHEVIGGLLARQSALLIDLASAPPIWNGNVAPLILRCMTDVYITFAWILNDPISRSKKYILFGLGQEKLQIEHYKARLEESFDETVQEMVEMKESWLRMQRHEYLIEVNVGNWSHLDTRKMSQEAGCEDLYKFAYSPFSSVVHNMWNHISLYNMIPCRNPLHKSHMIPAILDPPTDMDYLYRGVKYLDKTLRYFDKKTNYKTKTIYPLRWWQVKFDSK